MLNPVRPRLMTRIQTRLLTVAALAVATLVARKLRKRRSGATQTAPEEDDFETATEHATAALEHALAVATQSVRGVQKRTKRYTDKGA